MPPKLLHSSLIGWGSLLGGVPMTKATPIGLVGLPSSTFTASDVASFKTPSGTPALMPTPITPSSSPSSSAPTHAAAAEGECTAAMTTQFHHTLVGISAGTRHMTALTSKGNIIAMGNNKYGQIGQPVSATAAPRFGDNNNDAAAKKKNLLFHTTNSGSSNGEALESESLPFYYDLGYEEIRRLSGVVGGGGGGASNSQRDMIEDDNVPTRTVSGCNHNLFYRPGTTNVIAFGNNNMGQLGLGHKQMCLNTEGFAEWDRAVPWCQSAADRASGIKEIVCGQMHTMIIFNGGGVYGAGSNLCGELGVGDMHIDGQPRLVLTEGTIVKKGREDWTGIKQIACGMNFSLFLTHEGRVYATGSNNSNQIPLSSKVPELYPIHRELIAIPNPVEAINSSSSSTGGDKATAGTSNTNLVRIKFIAATLEAAVFVTSRNEVLVRGTMSEIGFNSGSRFHAVLPLPEDRCTQGRPMPHYHPEIIKITAKESNIVVTYADGRVVGCGSNIGGQVKITALAIKKGSEAAQSVAICGVGGSTDLGEAIAGGEGGGSGGILPDVEGSSSNKKTVNLAAGNCMQEVSLLMPAPLISLPPSSASSSPPPSLLSPRDYALTHLHIAHGFNFGLALDTSPLCGYEEGLVAYYRKDREARRARGEAVERVLMTEVVYPPIPKELGARPAAKTGSTYRRATRTSRVASGGVETSASLMGDVKKEEGTSEPLAPSSGVGGGGGGGGGKDSDENTSNSTKVTMEDLIKRRRAKLMF